MGVYLFKRQVLDHALWEDHMNAASSHDFGKDVLPRLVANGARVYAYPFSGYWMDVGTIESYWQAHMDLLRTPKPFDLNDRGWVVHTRSEERPPVWLARDAETADSMICEGCEIEAGALIDHSVLGPGVRVKAGAIVRESIILTDAVIGEGAIVERTVIDKKVRVGERAHIGAILEGVPAIPMIGKSSTIPADMVIEPGAVIGTDVIPTDFTSNRVRGDDLIQTKRLPYEV